MRCLFLLSLLGIFLVSPYIQAQEAVKETGFSLFNVLPQRTLLVTGVPDVTNVKKAFAQSNIYKLALDPEVHRFFLPLWEMVQPKVEKGLKDLEKNLGMSLEETLSVLDGELLVAVVDVVPGNNMPLGAVLSLEFGNQQQNFMQLLSTVQQKGRMKFTEQKWEGLSFYEMQRGPVCYAIIENTFVLASKKELLQEVISAYVGKSKEALLKDNPGVKKVASVLLHGAKQEEPIVPAFVFYANLESAFSTFGKAIPPHVYKIIEDLKIKDIRSLSMSMNLEGKDFHSTFFLYAPGAKDGIHSLYQGDAVNVQELAKNIPDFSTAFSCGKLNLSYLIASVENIIQILDPQEKMGLFMQYKQVVAAVEEQIGFSLKDDFATTFMGDTFSLAFYEGGLFAESASVIPVKDKEKAEKCIQKLADLLKIDRKVVELDGRTYSYFVNPLGKLGDNPFKKMERIKDPVQAVHNALSYGFSGMAYTYDGNYLYLGQTVQGLSSYMQWKNSNKITLADKKDFLDSIPKGNHLSFIYYNPQPSIHIWWNTLRSLVRYFEGYIRGAGIPIETSLLPRAQTLASYFSPGTVVISLEEDGLILSSKGSLDVMILGAAGVGVGAAIAIPGIVKAQERSKDAASMGKLRTLSTAIQLYHVEYAKYPPCGQELFQELLAKNLISPFDTENYECTSIPLEFYQANPNFPIVWTKQENKNGERMVLFFNGDVQKLYRYKFNWLLNDLKKLYQKSQSEK